MSACQPAVCLALPSRPLPRLQPAFDQYYRPLLPVLLGVLCEARVKHNIPALVHSLLSSSSPPPPHSFSHPHLQHSMYTPFFQSQIHIIPFLVSFSVSISRAGSRGLCDVIGITGNHGNAKKKGKKKVSVFSRRPVQSHAQLWREPHAERPRRPAKQQREKKITYCLSFMSWEIRNK